MNITLTVTAETDPCRLDHYLAEQIPEHSRSFYQKLLKDGQVLVNGRPAKPRHLVKADEEITLTIPELPNFPTPENRPLEILFEDDSVLVVNKPAGMVVHPNEVDGQGTLVQALLAHFPDLTQAVYDPESPVSRLRPGIVHRLDKDTTGVMVVAKTKAAMQLLAEQFQQHRTVKTYQALVFGSVDEAGTLQTKMRRTASDRLNLMGVAKEGEEGREAITHYKPLQHYFLPEINQAITLLECRIESGRTHQIRVHCKHLGHPVLGDQLYTNKTALSASRKLGINRQLLHAASLCFEHPESGEEHCYTASAPADFQAIIDRAQPA